jgi:hypothetical protein
MVKEDEEEEEEEEVRVGASRGLDIGEASPTDCEESLSRDETRMFGGSMANAVVFYSASTPNFHWTSGGSLEIFSAGVMHIKV